MEVEIMMCGTVGVVLQEWLKITRDQGRPVSAVLDEGIASESVSLGGQLCKPHSWKVYQGQRLAQINRKRYNSIYEPEGERGE